MGAGRYSAGRIFLQVVPSFKNVQKDTKREVDNLNKAMSKDLDKAAAESGQRAGRKAGSNYLMGFEKQAVADQKALNKALGKGLLDLDKMTKKSVEVRSKAIAKAWKDTLKEVKRHNAELAKEEARRVREAEAARKREDAEAARRAGKLKRAHIQAINEERGRNTKAARDRLKAAEREAADADKALRERMAARGGLARREIEKSVRAIEKNLGDIDLATPIGRELDRVQRKAKQVSRELSAGLINADTGRRQIETLGRDLERAMRRNRGSIGDSDRGNIKATVRDIRAMTAAMDGANSRGGMFSRMLRGATGDGQDGANAFRIFNYRVLGVAAALPLLVPLLAATGAGLVGIATAALGAAAGLGVMFLAFSGVFAAVKALGDVQDNSAKDALAASKTMRNAARGVRDAQQGLTQARVQAARAAEDSSRRIADAEENLAEAQKRATAAQNDLREARARAQADQEALADKIKSGALDERQALIDLFNAQVQYNAAMADGGATNLEKEQASIDLERAQLAIKGIRRDNKDMAAEQAKYAKQGVNGTEAVQSATERQQEAAKAVRDAEQGVADARRDAAQQAVDSARSIRDAQERLTDSQEAYQEALTQTGEIGSGSMQKLEQAMGKLSPAGQAFALYLHSLRDDFKRIRDIAQEGMLPGVQQMMESMFARYGPGMERFVGTMSRALGDFFVLVGETLQSPVWSDFFAMMEKNGPLFGRAFGEGFLNIATGIAGLMTAMEPFTVMMTEGWLDASAAFAEWGKSLVDSEGFKSFLAYMEKTGPKVWELLKVIGAAFVNLGVALAPIADKLLDFAITFFGWIANMDPDMLAAIATAIIGFVLASQLAAGATQALITLTTPFHSVLGFFVFLLVAVAAGLIYAYQHSDKFAAIVDKVLGFIRDNWEVLAWLGGALVTVGAAFFGVWKFASMFMGKLAALRFVFALLTGPVGIVVGILIALGALFVWLWNNNEDFKNGVLAAWAQIQIAAKWLWENAIKPYFSMIIEVWKLAATILLWVWNTVLWPVIKALATAVGWLWKNIISPIFGFIIGIWKTIAEIFLWGWSLIGPVFELFGAIVSALWDNVLSPIFGWIGDRFSDLGGIIADVWNDYIEPILDYFGLGADDLKRAWDGAIEGIGEAWAGLQELVKAPMRFILETVINKGFVAGFNELAEFFGTTPIKPLSLSWLDKAPSRATYGQSGPKGKRSHGYATGGYTGPGAKYQPAGIVHADEYVIRKEATNRLRAKYGLSALDYINQHGELPGRGYATGGLVGTSQVYKQMGAWVRANLPGKVITSDYRPGAITALGNRSNHGRGLAVDIGPPDMAAFNKIKAEFGKAILQLFYSPANGAQVLNGKNWNSDPVTRSNHWDHIHWAMRSMQKGADLGGGWGVPSWLSNPFNFVKDKVMGFADKLGDNPFGKFLTAVPTRLLSMAKDKISDMIGLSEPEDKSSGGTVGGQYFTGGHVTGLRDNGTMMYDNGGYLPPGITTVMNLTGRPEPVFTADQWDGMGKGAGGGSLIGNLDIDLNGSDVTAGDVVHEILYQVERVSHGGKYAGWSD